MLFTLKDKTNENYPFPIPAIATTRVASWLTPAILRPPWANYITQDIDGYYVWENMPGFNEGTRTYCNRSPALYDEVFPVSKAVPMIMKITSDDILSSATPQKVEDWYENPIVEK